MEKLEPVKSDEEVGTIEEEVEEDDPALAVGVGVGQHLGLGNVPHHRQKIVALKKGSVTLCPNRGTY